MILRRVDAFQQRHAVPGFGYAVIRKFLDDAGMREAALITYYGFLSMFPLLLLGVAIVSEVLSRRPELRTSVVEAIVPPVLQDGINSAMADLSSSSVAFIAGVIGLVYSGLGVVVSASDTLNHVAAVPFRLRAGVIARYLRAIAGLAVILAGTIAVGGLTVAATLLPAFSLAGSLLGSCAVAFAVLLAGSRILLCRHAPFRALWPGALAGALAVTVILNVGAIVLPELVRRAGRVYGGFATVAGVFTLLYILSNALVLAAEIAAVRYARLWPRTLDFARPVPADARAMDLLAREQERMPAETIRYELRDPPG
ncbi:YihY/virulence factor BrkB family protein [Actinoplanes sp. NPDC051861]|uniref:YihY/virulence factor BrkB family protein n=1 Tax=Actinoplanes sp. NPDC051861 TaxID=3155170 RepID=UPI00342A1F15